MGTRFKSVVFTLSVALFACEGSATQSSGVDPSSTSGASTASPVDLAGTWTGTFSTTYLQSGSTHTDNGSASIPISPVGDGGTYQIAVGGACSLLGHVTGNDVKTEPVTCHSMSNDCDFSADYRAGSGGVAEGTLRLHVQLTQQTTCGHDSSTAQLSTAWTLTR